MTILTLVCIASKVKVLGAAFNSLILVKIPEMMTPHQSVTPWSGVCKVQERPLGDVAPHIILSQMPYAILCSENFF